jgi:hypothetical protein
MLFHTGRHPNSVLSRQVHHGELSHEYLDEHFPVPADAAEFVVEHGFRSDYQQELFRLEDEFVYAGLQQFVDLNLEEVVHQTEVSASFSEITLAIFILSKILTISLSVDLHHPISDS